MTVIALDIGTTKICAIAVDAHSGQVLEVLSEDNAFLPSLKTWEKIQDANAMRDKAERLCNRLIEKYAPIYGIGITGQMHGILYLNAQGEAISPLYTWQDESGLLPYKDGLSYVEYITRLSGYPMASGYGLTTLFYHMRNRQLPQKACSFCTIQDYVAMCLTGRTTPLVHITNAAGFGLFYLDTGTFDLKAIEVLGMDPGLLPEVTPKCEIMGKTKKGIPVAAAIGDNQASFLGSVGVSEEGLLVNVGTGSQVSLLGGNVEKPLPKGLEYRPYFEGRYLITGSSLCGGRAYALLEQFFRSVLSMAGVHKQERLYAQMDQLLSKFQEDENPLRVCTQFSGTREHPEARGSIENISFDNFTPGHLMLGFLNGMADELYQMVEAILDREKTKLVVASGNGVRKTPSLKPIISTRFGAPVRIPYHREEAAYGAALFAMTGAGLFPSLEKAQKMIRYEGE